MKLFMKMLALVGKRHYNLYHKINPLNFFKEMAFFLFFSIVFLFLLLFSKSTTLFHCKV